MPELNGPPAELRFTVSVTRKETGKTETYDMVGHVIPNPEPKQEKPDGSDSQHGGA